MEINGIKRPENYLIPTSEEVREYKHKTGAGIVTAKQYLTEQKLHNKIFELEMRIIKLEFLLESMERKGK